MNTKHFLILTQYFPPEVGAPQVRLFAFGRELVRLSHRVTVVTALPNYPAGKIFPEYKGSWFCREERDGMQILRAPLFAATGRGFARLMNYLSFSFMAFWAALNVPRPDIVFVESPPLFLGITGWLAAAWHRAKFIFNVSDLWPDSIEALGVAQKSTLRPFFMLEKFLYAKAWMICGVTHGVVRRIVEEKGVPAGKVCHLPNGADLEFLKPLAKDESLLSSLGLKTGTKIFLYAGVHGYAQNLDTLLRAAAKLKRPDIHFLFLGDGPEKSRLQKMAQQLSLSNVTFLAARPFSEIPKYFSLATASFASLMKTELFLDALPSKLIVSLACGVPPIFSGDGEAADLLRSGRCGLVVPPEDETSLCRAVCELADQPAMRHELAGNARRVAEERFAWKKIVGEWAGELNQIEIERIKKENARRDKEIPSDFYSLEKPGNLFIYEERLKKIEEILKCKNFFPLKSKEILEIGCGRGDWLVDFQKWEAAFGKLHGVDLMEERVKEAQRRLPGADIRVAEASALPWPPQTFDFIFQSTVFTSILDADLKKKIAGEMLRVLKPDGIILWYDFCFNNPANPAVRGIKASEIRSLFPGCRIALEKITLAPPIARSLAPISRRACAFLENIKFLNTHYLGVIRHEDH